MTRSPFMKSVAIDAETIDRLRQVAAIDQDQVEIALQAMGGNEAMFREFAEQSGVSGLRESQELLKLIKIRDHRRINTEQARGRAQDTAESKSVQSSMSMITTFLAGLSIGISLGILFAPVSGEETRSNLQQRGADLADFVRDLIGQQGKIGELRERVRSTISAVRGQPERATGSGQKA
jgi:gas vesicle protein